MKNSGIEWIGEIPEDWEVVYLSSIFDEHKRKNTGLVCKNLLSLSYGKIKRKDINTTDGLLPESFEGYNIIEKGDIVLRLTDLQNDQRSLRTGIAQETGLITSAYTTIRCLPRIASPQYMHYYLHSFDTSKGFYGMGDGVRQGLNFDGIKKIFMLLPPIAKQQRIADYLDKKCAAVDRLMENQRLQIEKLKEYKQSLITEAVTKGLDKTVPLKSSGVEWIGDIPEGWKVKKMLHVCNLITDYVASGSFADLASNVTYLDYPDYALLVRTIDVSKKGHNAQCVYIDKHAYDFLSNSNLFGGELMFPNIGASVGDVYIVPKLYEKMSLAPNSIMVRGKNNNKFIYYYFLTNIGRNSLLDIAKSTAQPKFNKTDFRQLKIIFPPLSEQQQIAESLDKKCAEIDGLISIKQQKIEKLTEYKKSLIYEYVTGKKQVG